MLKKVIGYGIVGLLAITLIAGTAWIVLSPADTRTRQDRNDTTVTESGGELFTGLNSGNEQGQGRGRTQIDISAGSGEQTGKGLLLSATGQWETLQGVVTAADIDVTLQTASGDVIIGMGPAHYREEAGFTVNVGDELAVNGYTENEEFKAGTVENYSTGKTIVLRDETGHPMWAGQGNLRNRQP